MSELGADSITLTRFILDEQARHPEAQGDLTILMTNIQVRTHTHTHTKCLSAGVVVLCLLVLACVPSSPLFAVSSVNRLRVR